MQEILKRMQTRIMKHQQETGFESIFDFLNEDIEELNEQIKNLKTPDVSNQGGLLIAFGMKVASDILTSDKNMNVEDSYEDFKSNL